MALKTTVVGHTTMTTSKILAVFEGALAGRKARLAFKNGLGAPQVIDVEVTAALPYGLASFGLTGLAGGSVRYAVADYAAGAAPDPALMLEGAAAKTFRLQPDGPLRIALVSCNDILSPKIQEPRSGAMWRRLKALVDSGEVDLIVHAGDQIYGDGNPKGWIKEEGRVGAYRRHYVGTWAHQDVAAVLGSCPNIMMWDDHEIFDGYGSNDNDGSPDAQKRYLAAEQAFREFQDALNPPDKLTPGFGWIGRYKDVAVIAVDGRSKRQWARGTILGKQQLDAFELALGQLKGFKHLFVVVGTPVVYIPLIAAEKLTETFHLEQLDDLRDGWTASNNRDECRAFLMRLLNFAAHEKNTQVTIVGGDIHVGTLAQINTRLGFGPDKFHPRLYQVTASGIARPAPSGAERILLGLAANAGGKQELFNQDVQGELLKINGSDSAHCVMHRNFAVLDPSDGQGNLDPFGNLRVRFHSEQTPTSVHNHLLPKL